jgi:Cd2+/Zn2+-exporting ATPase
MSSDATTDTRPRVVRFKVDGLDCQNEVRALKTAVGPLVGGDQKLSFDTKTGTMEVAADVAVPIEAIERAVASTGMRASPLAAPVPASPLLFKVQGLDCKNEVAALKRELGPLVGEAWLSFDTSKGVMTVAPQSRASADEIAARVAPTGMRASLWQDEVAEPLLFRVHGLDCQNEVASLSKAIGPLIGADRLAFDTAQGTMTVAPRNAVASADIERAVATTGMRAELWSPPVAAPASDGEDAACSSCGDMTRAVLATPVPAGQLAGKTFRIQGMDCADEVAILRREIGPLVGGGDNLAFDLLNSRMTLLASAPPVSTESIREAVRRTGMTAIEWRPQDAKARDAGDRHRRQQVWFTSLSGAFVALGFGIHIWSAGGFTEALRLLESHAGQTVPRPEIAAYVAAIAFGGRFIVVKAWYAARSFRPDMNLLMTVAVLGAIVIGEWFEAATVTFLFALSLALESWSVGRARRAIAALLDLAPPVVRLIRPDGSEATVAVAEIKPGDRFIVSAGERIALDGRVVAGSSSINQAPITGESVPVEKEAGGDVFAGTINGDGTLTVEATRVAEDTTLARIIRMVEEAHSRRAPSEQWVERFARVYTPAVMMLALLVFLVPPVLFGALWHEWFYRALVLLVIACPCALVISTPVSIVAALAASARSGVLVKGGAYIELPARLKAIAMDKTGTLTRGEPEVVRVMAFNRHNEAELLARAAALESRSTHPLARAVLRHAKEKGVHIVPAEDVQVLKGKGLTGRFDGDMYWLGSHRYVVERGKDEPNIARAAEDLEHDGKTVIVVGNERHVCGLIAVADTIRPEARDIVAQLHAAGIARVVMLTGDNRITAEAVAREAGIDEVHAELLPEDKLAKIDEMVKHYGLVGMVGDGVNDAPALARANLGIAMGAIGSDAAIETADVALMADDISKLPWLVRHSKRTLAVIRQNIGFSLGVKVVFVVLTFAGIASLWGAIAADMGASLLVVLNGLRLLNRGPAVTSVGGRSAQDAGTHGYTGVPRGVPSH